MCSKHAIPASQNVFCGFIGTVLNSFLSYFWGFKVVLYGAFLKSFPSSLLQQFCCKLPFTVATTHTTSQNNCTFAKPHQPVSELAFCHQAVWLSWPQDSCVHQHSQHHQKHFLVHVGHLPDRTFPPLH